MGTIVNALAIIIGSLIGLILKKGISEKYHRGINNAIGLAIFMLGLNGLISNVMKINEGKLNSNFELLIVISLVIGVIIGEFLKIDYNLNGIAGKVEKKFKLNSFSKAFVTSSIIYCVGAMAIIGSINDGLLHDPSILYIKAILDGIMSIIFAASMGIGVLFAFIPVAILQGTITLLATTLSQVLQGDLLLQICSIGYLLLVALGLNLLKITNIKIANFLPSLLIPIIYYYLLFLI